ncbi:MAG TPA: hypothetical protein VGX95_15170 [Xanthobacteraceae bacterium]|jgi:hypothetical protein|nr:hypothetical protein [Xanthobacteraceae bacterium]
MATKINIALAAVLVLASASAALTLCAPAFADSVDGSPVSRTDRYLRASVRGSASILFEDRGVLGPLGPCMRDDGDADPRSCDAQGAF